MDIVAGGRMSAEAEAQLLADKRFRNDQKYKRRLEAIAERYAQDFDDIADEIDIHTGEIVVNRGHLEGMQTEYDTGLPDPIPSRRSQNDQDEDAAEEYDEAYDEDEEEDDDEGVAEPEEPYNDQDEDTAMDYDVYDTIDEPIARPLNYKSLRDPTSSLRPKIHLSRSVGHKSHSISRTTEETRTIRSGLSQDLQPHHPQSSSTSLARIEEGAGAIVSNAMGSEMLQKFSTSIAQQIASFVDVLVQQKTVAAQAPAPIVQSNIFIGPNQRHSTYIKQAPHSRSRNDHRSTHVESSSSRRLSKQGHAHCSSRPHASGSGSQRREKLRERDSRYDSQHARRQGKRHGEEETSPRDLRIATPGAAPSLWGPQGKYRPQKPRRSEGHNKQHDLDEPRTPRRVKPVPQRQPSEELGFDLGDDQDDMQDPLSTDHIYNSSPRRVYTIEKPQTVRARKLRVPQTIDSESEEEIDTKEIQIIDSDEEDIERIYGHEDIDDDDDEEVNEDTDNYVTIGIGGHDSDSAYADRAAHGTIRQSDTNFLLQLQNNIRTFNQPNGSGDHEAELRRQAQRRRWALEDQVRVFKTKKQSFVPHISKRMKIEAADEELGKSKEDTAGRRPSLIDVRSFSVDILSQDADEGVASVESEVGELVDVQYSSEASSERSWRPGRSRSTVKKSRPAGSSNRKTNPFSRRAVHDTDESGIDISSPLVRRNALTTEVNDGRPNEKQPTGTGYSPSFHVRGLVNESGEGSSGEASNDSHTSHPTPRPAGYQVIPYVADTEAESATPGVSQTEPIPNAFDDDDVDIVEQPNDRLAADLEHYFDDDGTQSGDLAHSGSHHNAELYPDLIPRIPGETAMAPDWTVIPASLVPQVDLEFRAHPGWQPSVTRHEGRPLAAFQTVFTSGTVSAEQVTEWKAATLWLMSKNRGQGMTAQPAAVDYRPAPTSAELPDLDDSIDLLDPIDPSLDALYPPPPPPPPPPPSNPPAALPASPAILAPPRRVGGTLIPRGKDETPLPPPKKISAVDAKLRQTNETWHVRSSRYEEGANVQCFRVKPTKRQARATGRKVGRPRKSDSERTFTPRQGAAFVSIAPANGGIMGSVGTSGVRATNTGLLSAQSGSSKKPPLGKFDRLADSPSLRNGQILVRDDKGRFVPGVIGQKAPPPRLSSLNTGNAQDDAGDTTEEEVEPVKQVKRTSFRGSPPRVSSPRVAVVRPLRQEEDEVDF